MRKDFECLLENALALDLPYSHRLPHLDLSQGRNRPPAAVLLLFAYQSSKDEFQDPRNPMLLFTKRTETVETHKGQMAFPGGMSELQDHEDPIVTALRETEEEVGLLRDQIQVLGKLPSLHTVTGFLIQPVVGVLKSYLMDTHLTPNPDEIAELLWAPLQTLCSPETYRQEVIQAGSFQVPIDVYQVAQHRIWGATGAMTKNLLDRLSINLRSKP